MSKFFYFVIVLIFVVSSCKEEDNGILYDEFGQPCERLQPVDPNDLVYDYNLLNGVYNTYNYGCICTLIENPNSIYDNSMTITNDLIIFGGGQSYTYQLDNGIIRFNNESFYLGAEEVADEIYVSFNTMMDLECNYLYRKD